MSFRKDAVRVERKMALFGKNIIITDYLCGGSDLSADDRTQADRCRHQPVGGRCDG